MILFVDNNVGVLFLKKISGAIKGYITGTINTLSTLVGVMLGYGVVSVEVQTLSTVAGYTRGYGRRTVQIYTRSIVQAFLNLPIWVTEVIKKVSSITTIFKRNSKIDGD